MLCEAEWKQKENEVHLKVLHYTQELQHWKLATSRTAAPTAQPLPKPPPLPRKEQQAVAGVHSVPTAEQKRVQLEALVIAKETAYRQLIADMTVDMHGLQAQALQAESAKLRTEYCICLAQIMD